MEPVVLGAGIALVVGLIIAVVVLFKKVTTLTAQVNKEYGIGDAMNIVDSLDAKFGAEVVDTDAKKSGVYLSLTSL